MSDPVPSSPFTARLIRLSSLLTAPPRNSWRQGAVVAAVLAGLMAILLSSPAVFVNDVPFDLFIPLDGAWRMANGQWPHVDFSTPIGLLYYLEVAAGYAIAGTDPRLVLWANALALLPVTLGALLATRGRLSPVLRVSVVLAIALLAIAPRMLDQGPGRLAHLAFYNRQGAALVVIALLALFLQPVTRGKWSDLRDALLIAACGLATAYMKVTFLGFMVGGLLVAVAFGPNRRLAGWSLLMIAGGLALSAIIAPEAAGAYLSDLSLAAQASSNGTPLSRLNRLPEIIAANMGFLSAIAVLGLAVLRTSQGADERRQASRTLLVLMALTAGSLLVTLQNHDAFVTTSLVPLLLAFIMVRDRKRTASVAPLLAALPLIWIWGGALVMDAGSIIMQRIGSTIGRPLSDTGPLARIVVPKLSADEPKPLQMIVDGRLSVEAANDLELIQSKIDLPYLLNDGLSLLSSHIGPQSHILSLSFAPFFPFATQTPPPRHSLAWWDYQRTYSKTALPDINAMIGASDYVMVPKIKTRKDAMLWTIVGPTIEARYTVIASTPLWALWARP